MGVENTIIVDNVDYDSQRKQYIMTTTYIQDWLKEQGLEARFIGKEEFDLIRFICSDRFYNYQFGEERMYPEDFAKKQHLLITDSQNVLDSLACMREDMKSIIASRRDLVDIEHGVNFDEGKVIEDFYETIKKQVFSPQTMRVMNRNRVLAYKERLNLRVIANLGVGF